MQQQQGFSVVELTIIISIIATLITTYIYWYVPKVDDNAARVITTKEKLATISAHLQRYYNIHSRLPCPSDPSLPFSSKPADLYLTLANGTNRLFDDENIDPDQPNACVSNIGAIPTHALNLAAEFQFDGFNRRFSYLTSHNLCSADGCTVSNFTNLDGAITIYDLAGASVSVSKVAFVVYSHGIRGADAYLASGEQLFTTATTTEQINLNFNNSTQELRHGPLSPDFGHILLFRTKDQLIKRKQTQLTKFISLTECQNIKNSIQQISRSINNGSFSSQATISANLPSNLDFTDQNRNTISGGAASLEILWLLQNYCFSKYPGASIDETDPVQGCPGGASYDQNYNLCRCDNGSFNNDC